MIHSDEIIQIVQSIWASILNLPIEVSDINEDFPSSDRSRSFTGCVQLTGDFEGATLLHCPSRLAIQLSALMFEEETDKLSIEDVQDALGELTNMVAGNIKPLLKGHSRLSLPSVVEGSDYHLNVPGSYQVQLVKFRCLGEVMAVTLQARSKS